MLLFLLDPMFLKLFALVCLVCGWILVFDVAWLGHNLDQPDGEMTVTLIKEIQMPDGDVLKYRVEIPPISDADAEQQKLIVAVDEVDQEPQILAKTATEAFFEVPQGSQVQLFLSYMDDADPPNAGPSTSTEVFIAKDKIAPGAPGPFGTITCISEIAAEPVPEPAPEPAPEPEPVVEEGAQGPVAEPVPEEPPAE